MYHDTAMRNHSGGNLSYLLSGKVPHLGQRPKSERRERDVTSNRQGLDFSAFPPEIENMRNGRGKPVQTPAYVEPRVETPRFDKIRSEGVDLNQISRNIELYDMKHARKRRQMHEEWENMFVQPFEKIMKKKLTGRPYTAFRKTRSRAVSALSEENHPCILIDDDEYTAPPSLKLKTDNLEDRVHKYQRKIQHDKKLEQIVKESTGDDHPVPNFKERNTLDTQAWRILPETRFFGADGPSPKGTRIFSKKFNSVIENTINNFQ